MNPEIERIYRESEKLVRRRARASNLDNQPVDIGGISFNCLSDPAQLRNGDRAAVYRIQGKHKNPCKLLEKMKINLTD